MMNMKIAPILENVFYHDGRGPKLQRVIWAHNGTVLVGFEYFNPDDKYEMENLKHIKLVGAETVSMSLEEVHCNILVTGDSKAAIIEVQNSEWLASFSPPHLAKCKHYQIMFYDEVYDIVCQQVEAGAGKLNA